MNPDYIWVDLPNELLEIIVGYVRYCDKCRQPLLRECQTHYEVRESRRGYPITTWDFCNQTCLRLSPDAMEALQAQHPGKVLFASQKKLRL